MHLEQRHFDFQRKNEKLSLWKLFYMLHFYSQFLTEKINNNHHNTRKYCICFLVPNQSWDFPADKLVHNQSHTLLNVLFCNIIHMSCSPAPLNWCSRIQCWCKSSQKIPFKSHASPIYTLLTISVLPTSQ